MKKLARYDYALFVPALALALTGLVIVYSASSTLAREKLGFEFYFLERHSLYFAAGMALCLLFAHLPYYRLASLSPLIVFAALFSLALVLVPGIGIAKGGATRWIGLGPFTVQPSEGAKVALVIYLARYASKERDLLSFAEGYLKPALVAGALILPVLAQPDFGTSVTMCACFLLMLYVAGSRLRWPVGIATGLLPVAAFLVLHSEYRRRRLVGFMDPWNDMTNTGFQIIQSLLAFQGGGIAGRGLGEGRQKLFFLPEAHSDFVLSVVGEELGLLGVAFVFLCFGILVWRGYSIAMRNRDPFGRLLAFGLTTMIGLQAAVNGAVVLGLLPTKGLTLPLVSYGGTSLMVTLACIGILMNVSAHTDFGASRAPASGAFQPGSVPA